MTDPVTVVATAAAEELAVRFIDAALTAFEGKLHRDELVARVVDEVRKGMPLERVPDFIVAMRDSALAKFKN